MDMAKLKERIPSIPALPAIDHPLIKRADNVLDLKTLGIGLAALLTLYLSINLYVSFSADATLEKLKERLPHQSTALHHGSAQPQHGSTNQNQNTHHTAAPHDEQNLDSAQYDTQNVSFIAGLHQNTSAGVLPTVRSSDNLTSFQAYKHPFDLSAANGKPVVSFLIMDYGLSKKSSVQAIDSLPSEVSFVLSSYATTSTEWLKIAISEGHEVWLDMPIQSKKSPDLGKNTIFHHASRQEKESKFRQNLSRTQGYVGMVSYTDDSLDEAKDHYSEIFNEAFERGLGYVELNIDAPATMAGKALTHGAPYLRTSMNVFQMKGPHSFEELETLAKQNGHVLAVVPASPQALKTLALWIEKVGRIDYTIAPVSALYDLPFHTNQNHHE